MLVVLAMVTVARAAAAAADPQFLSVSWELLKTARYGQTTKEHAAFLVSDSRGGLELVRWAWGAETLRASYRGAIPEGTIAIVHTHPNTSPNPSGDDVATARRLGIPVYVLTRSAVTRTDGVRTETVAWGDWNPAR